LPSPKSLSPGAEPRATLRCNSGCVPGRPSDTDWLAARIDLLAKEKALARQRDALSEDRRKLSMVRPEKAYTSDGPDGPRSLQALFGRRRQLIIYHFMFGPSCEQGCPSCSHCADNSAGCSTKGW
jgi:predicted dithiol-disulfide oxidoreductase (DUF899 family)